jgi:hypothetical protein
MEYAAVWYYMYAVCVCAAWQDYDILLSVRYYSECCLPAPFINDKIMG